MPACERSQALSLPTIHLGEPDRLVSGIGERVRPWKKKWTCGFRRRMRKGPREEERRFIGRKRGRIKRRGRRSDLPLQLWWHGWLCGLRLLRSWVIWKAGGSDRGEILGRRGKKKKKKKKKEELTRTIYGCSGQVGRSMYWSDILSWPQVQQTPVFKCIGIHVLLKEDPANGAAGEFNRL